VEIGASGMGKSEGTQSHQAVRSVLSEGKERQEMSSTSSHKVGEVFCVPDMCYPRPSEHVS